MTLLKTSNKETVSILFKKLKDIYKTNTVSKEKRDHIIKTVNKYGYLPISHQEALETISTAETLIGLEEKFKLNNVFNNNNFTFSDDNISPIKRAGYKDSSWLRKEQLNIKLINLAALGNGKKDESKVGHFEDWIKQLLIAPSGNVEFGNLGTVMYLVPFHPRDFGCAYLPKSKFVSETLEDDSLKKELNLDGKEQVKLFLLFSQLSGHPTMYDVLPQTGRYSSTIIANPYIARWFDIPELNKKLREYLATIEKELETTESPKAVKEVLSIIDKALDGGSENVPVEYSDLEEQIEKRLSVKKKLLSEEMTSKDYQVELIKKINAVIANELGVKSLDNIKEEDIGDKHNNIIGLLINKGLWPAPGGAWCSCGIPIYDRMSACGGHPLFLHYDNKGTNVTHLANLDCQSPFYFVHLETGEYNQPVIDFWCNFLVDLQQEYNFDSFRIDHIDHIVDKVSQDKDGNPISYRAPSKVLAEAITTLRKKENHFGVLAEYMLWEGFLKEYHEDMGFDLLWGSDIVSQYMKTIETIIRENEELKAYNLKFNNQTSLSILKTYNNQDGEFREIDQYPAQMGPEGALFKWFKLKFLPSAHSAERPVMYIDGDESFTAIGVEKVIGTEISLTRNNDKSFFTKFDAINRFATNDIFCRFGISEIHHGNHNDEGLVAWTIKKQPEFGDDERLFIVANENPPKQIIRKANGEFELYSETKTYDPVLNAKIFIPEGFRVVSEYLLPDNCLEFTESYDIENLKDSSLTFDKLKPAEFHLYKIERIL